MNTREHVLESIRAALKDSPEVPLIPRSYRRSLPLATEELVEVLVDRLKDYKAGVTVVDPSQIPATVEKLLAQAGSYVVPAGLDPEWLAWNSTDLRCRTDGGEHGALSVADLDAIDAVVTASAVTVAESGTIILDAGPGQGRRAISLIPDHHICIVRAADIVGILPEALVRIDGTRPLTMISGPSATSDIELERVEGVHGPRRLDVIIVDTDGHADSAKGKLRTDRT